MCIFTPPLNHLGFFYLHESGDVRWGTDGTRKDLGIKVFKVFIMKEFFLLIGYIFTFTWVRKEFLSVEVLQKSMM